MSMKKKRELKKEKKLQEYKDTLAGQTGLYFSTEIKAAPQGFPFVKYLVNALALFGSTYGSMSCLISSFHLEIADMVLFLVCVVMALVMAFMYANQAVKMITYLLILVGSVLLVARYYLIINSGISAIHNICLERIDAVFELPQMREYTEFYTNQYVSMTMACCVLSLALMVILNIFISEFMNFMWVFLITLPIVQFGMYFSFDAAKLSMLCVMASWLLIAGVRYTNSYNGVTRKLKSTSSVKKHCHYYGFVTDSRNVSRIALVLMVFILALSGVLLLMIPQNNFEFSTRADQWKENTNQGVKDYLSYGMSSLFPVRSEKTKPGRISNSKSIQFDGQTDMRVTLVDYGQSRIYLRNYIGVQYIPYSYMWSDKIGETDEEYSDTQYYYNRTGRILEFDYNHNQEVTQSRHRMDVELVDKQLAGSEKTLFVPYYSLLEEKGEYRFVNDGKVCYEGDISETEVQSYTFYTQDSRADESSIQDIYYKDGEELPGSQEFTEKENDYYNDVIRKNYLSVPLENVETLSEFCEEYKLYPGDADIVQKVIDVLTNQYDYTLRPGSVPAGEEYVNYFLKNSKKGYCVHFATSATLLFRYLGVPARYAEGYVVDAQNFDMAEERKEEKVSDWISGVQAENAVVEEVPVTDANGHAWVEIYEYGLGWVPVEVTQAASIDEDGGFFANLLGNSGNVSQATENIMNQVNQIDIQKTKNNLLRLLILGVILFLVLYIARMLRIVLVRHRGFATASNNVNISNRYQHLYEIFKYNCEEMMSCLSYAEFSDMLCDKAFISKEERDNFYHLMEKAVFSGQELAEKEYHMLLSTIHICRKAVIKQMNVKKRFGYYILRILW